MCLLRRGCIEWPPAKETTLEMNRLQQLLVNRFWNRTHQHGGATTWGQEAGVRQAINRRITGNEHQWPVEWFASEIAKEAYPRVLSLGCGVGALERDLASKGLCGAALGVDLSEQALEIARQKARLAGYTHLDYQRADLDQLRLEPKSFDAVFVHQALHHVRDLEGCLVQVAKALTPRGVFYADEYVGPSRHEWKRELLQTAEAVFQQLPRAVRRRRRLQLPVDWRDPSEAVRSSDILPVLAEHFEIFERRDYGGNLLALIHPFLRLDELPIVERRSLIDDLLGREDELLAAGAQSFYTVLVARPFGSSSPPFSPAGDRVAT